MAFLSFMKMKNYLSVPLPVDDDGNSMTINVSISYREILRIKERFASSPDFYGDYKIVRVVDSGALDEYSVQTDDLYGSDSDGFRFFEIVKK